MKKSINILSIASIALILTAFSAKDQRPEPDKDMTYSDFSYAMGSRFLASITKENLHKATSINDIVPKEANWGSFPIQTIEVSILDGNSETSEVSAVSDNLDLNTAQIQLLQSINYSENFRLNANYIGKFENIINSGNYELNYYFSVIPERPAKFSAGKDAFIGYIMEHSKNAISYVLDENLQPGKIFFSVTTNGTISNVNLASSSGYNDIDEKILKLITNAPGKWIPAQNSKGEKVEQDLWFFFGKIGC